ncbi:G1 family glutamic endopeptidase [Desulfosporosinus orientis]|nr:G1 family glutamic endopeptidase [Desulfosporosinus orientis]
MKIRFYKLHIVLLAVLITLSASSLGVPNDIYLRGFSHKSMPFPEISQQTTSSTAAEASVSLPENTQVSSNWAGYIVTPSFSGDPYNSVSGTWTVPNITASQEDALAAQWIGLGGVLSSDLLQMGTIEQIQNGEPVADVFWEQLPSAAQTIMTVPIGATITASISKATDSTWNLSFTVNGETPTQTIPSVTLDESYAQGIGTSAEWISEDPSNANGQLYPLADMGTVQYQDAMANDNPINDSTNTVQPVALVSRNGSVLITPSELGADGQSFSTSVIAANTQINTNSNTNTNTNTNPTPYPGINTRLPQGPRPFGNERSSLNWRGISSYNR